MITISERFPQLFVFRAISIASHVHLLSRRTLIMGRLIKIQSRFRSHELSHFFLLWLIDLSCLLCDRRSRINLIRPLLEESRRIYSSLMPTPLGTWLGLSRISLFPSHLNLSSHALIYNLLFLMNLKSEIYVVLFSFWLTIEVRLFPLVALFQVQCWVSCRGKKK